MKSERLQRVASFTRRRSNSFPIDYLRFRVSNAFLSQKFDLPKSAPRTFEFIGIRKKPEVKYDSSKPSKGAIEIAAKGYIGNSPGEYESNEDA